MLKVGNPMPRKCFFCGEELKHNEYLVCRKCVQDECARNPSQTRLDQFQP